MNATTYISRPMQVVIDQPPNYAEIVARFPAVGQYQRKVIFAVGDVIYNPRRMEISPALFVHEGVHGHRQGANPFEWWKRYLDDDEWRFAEEMVAHVAEYEATVAGAGRQVRRRAFKQVASKLASPIYEFQMNTKRATQLMKEAFNERHPNP